MPKFRKKPVVIEAFCYGHEEWPEWFEKAVRAQEIGVCHPYCIIQTLEGEMMGHRGDYIIQGVRGEIYPCKADIFEATYEPAQDIDVTVHPPEPEVRIVPAVVDVMRRGMSER